VSHVELVAIVVDDYDAAIEFFVDVLEFDLIEDSPSLTNDGHPKRWVVRQPLGPPRAGLTVLRRGAPRRCATMARWSTRAGNRTGIGTLGFALAIN